MQDKVRAMEAGDVYYATEQRLQWHPSIHELVGHEALHYWFLTFATSYEWDDLRGELLTLLQTHDVHSFALYELMGDCDVLLRVWLPEGRAGAFRAALQSRLTRFSLTLDAMYRVERVIRHWPFGPKGAGEVKKLEGESAHPSSDLIDQVNGKLRDGASLADPDLAALAVGGAIGPEDGSRDQIKGVKIVTLVKPTGALGGMQRQSLGKQMALTLDVQEKLVQRSLYEVEGFGAAFLLTCTVPIEDFFCFRDGLISVLAPLFESAGIRTTSYSCGSPDLLLFQDVIPQPGSRSRRRAAHLQRVTDLLKLDESMTLEVKGSAFAPLEPWLFNGEELLESPNFFNRSVLKTVVAFLNSEGGSVVIGALERNRYQRAAPLDDIAEFKEIGGYMCAGIKDPLFMRKGWDAYERKMSDMIAKNISPTPSSLVRIRNEEVDGIIFCVVDVEPGQEIEWHYLQAEGEGPKFMVRDGARTVHLQGLEADHYKRRAKQ
jgi:schlafen family protein